ncbi:zinc finger protein 385A-like isoform X2 [Platichthys flesus]|uniref:zinc finger protein 385A-like isoform X2 n=1 Tax=Platichthys flesus TaxID=8260 RepID=UPI002DBEE7A6|nr:zinc finger protein 385A-like isoform X2 [Platichthys flesus]
MILGSVNRPGPVPAFLRSPAVMPSPLDMKPFLQFPMESPHPASIGLFHNFNTMDPVQKAIMTHTFGPPMVRTKRPIISCNVCQIRFNSESQAEAHYKGNRHARRVKGIETSKTARLQDGDKQPPPPTATPSPPGPSPSSPVPDPNKQDVTPTCPSSNESPLTPSSLPSPTLSLAEAEFPLVPSASSPLTSSPSPNTTLSTPSIDPAVAALIDSLSPVPSPSSGESEEEKAKKLLYCSLCKVAVNSLSQLEAHNKGTKHKTILEARSGLGPIKAYPRLGPKPSPEQGGELSSDPDTQERTFHCEICNVRVNSELQLKQHISSRRHRDGVAGKPNPLLSRHKKRTDFMELSKTLGGGLIPNHLAVAAAMAAAATSNQLALRPAGPASHHHHHLLQGTALSLLRPAPGPIRTTHGPILFSPY